MIANVPFICLIICVSPLRYVLQGISQVSLVTQGPVLCLRHITAAGTNARIGQTGAMVAILSLRMKTAVARYISNAAFTMTMNLVQSQVLPAHRSRALILIRMWNPRLRILPPRIRTYALQLVSPVDHAILISVLVKINPLQPAPSHGIFLVALLGM